MVHSKIHNVDKASLGAICSAKWPFEVSRCKFCSCQHGKNSSPAREISSAEKRQADDRKMEK